MLELREGQGSTGPPVVEQSAPEAGRSHQCALYQLRHCGYRRVSVPSLPHGIQLASQPVSHQTHSTTNTPTA